MSAGYSGTPLVKKLGIKTGFTVAAVGAPDHYRSLLGELPADVAFVDDDARGIDLAHLFVRDRAAVGPTLDRLRERITPDGTIWVSWPKKASKVPTDVTEDVVRELALAAGLVDVKVCAVDDVWSGLKLVYRLKDRPARRGAAATGVAIGVLAAVLVGCGAAEAPAQAPALDAWRMAETVRFLSADSLAGRRTGTLGNAAARAHIVAEFERLGLEAMGGTYTREFAFEGRESDGPQRGVNVIGRIAGTARPDRTIVVTAHYDHLGIGRPDDAGDSIYNGADDNASGTAAILALAAYFREHPLEHSMIFAALDAEEMGLRGARAFIADPPVPLESIALNVNLDMVGRNERGELYVAGTHHYPFLRPDVEAIAAAAPVTLRFGHDRPDLPAGDDWTNSSDHGPFHGAGIPFLYFGVEDHPDYHKPSDEFDGIQPDFLARAAETVLQVVMRMDRRLPALEAERGGRR